MKTIKFDSKIPNTDQMYDTLDKILFFGAEHLPFIFLKKVYLDGKQYQLPRWITQKHMDSINRETQQLMNELNWE